MFKVYKRSKFMNVHGNYLLKVNNRNTIMIMEISSMINIKMDLFVKKIESIQYKVALAIIGAIQGTSRERIYQELGIESLKSRRCISASVACSK